MKSQAWDMFGSGVNDAASMYSTNQMMQQWYPQAPQAVQQPTQPSGYGMNPAWQPTVPAGYGQPG